MKNAENLCTKAGCPAACCQNIGFQLSPSEATLFTDSYPINRIDPKNLQVTNLDEIPSIPTGFTVVKDPEDTESDVYVYVKGPCPHLNQTTLDCNAYAKKQRPGLCSEVPIGHPTCDSQRIRKGLSLLRTRSAG